MEGGEGQPEVQPTTAEEMLELAVGTNKYKIPLSVDVPFKHNGQMTKVPFGQLLNNYRNSSKQSDRALELKKLQEQLEAQKAGYQNYDVMRQKYEAIQKWSEENPDQFEELMSLWKTRVENRGSDPNAAEIMSLRKELGELKEFKSQFEKTQEEKEDEANVKAITGEIEAFKKEFPEINLDERDEEGATLWAKIVNFGVEKKIPEFEAAALKFLKPKLLETLSKRARNETVKGIQKDTQQGIVARSRTPFGTANGQSASLDPRKLSWEKLKDAAREEFQELIKG